MAEKKVTRCENCQEAVELKDEELCYYCLANKYLSSDIIDERRLNRRKGTFVEPYDRKKDK